MGKFIKGMDLKTKEMYLRKELKKRKLDHLFEFKHNASYSTFQGGLFLDDDGEDGWVCFTCITLFNTNKVEINLFITELTDDSKTNEILSLFNKYNYYDFSRFYIRGGQLVASILYPCGEFFDAAQCIDVLLMEFLNIHDNYYNEIMEIISNK